MSFKCGQSSVSRYDAPSPLLRYATPNDKHGIVPPVEGTRTAVLSPLAKLLLVAGHCHPTLGLHDVPIGLPGGMVGIGGDGAVETLLPPVEAGGHGR